MKAALLDSAGSAAASPSPPRMPRRTGCDACQAAPRAPACYAQYHTIARDAEEERYLEEAQHLQGIVKERVPTPRSSVNSFEIPRHMLQERRLYKHLSKFPALHAQITAHDAQHGAEAPLTTPPGDRKKK